MLLSPHFQLEEFTVSTLASQHNIDNTPTPDVLEQLSATAEMLERIRTVLGQPIIITSGYRCPKVNQLAGGVANSHHVTGQAVDFVSPAFGSPLAICRALEAHGLDKLGVDQLIYEFGAWVHVSQAGDAGRRMALTIDNAGTRHGFA